MLFSLLQVSERRSHDSLQGREARDLVRKLQVQRLERRVKTEVETRFPHEARCPSMVARFQEEDVEGGIDGVLPRMRHLP